MNPTTIKEAYELELKESSLLQLYVCVSFWLSYFVDVCGDKGV